MGPEAPSHLAELAAAGAEPPPIPDAMTCSRCGGAFAPDALLAFRELRLCAGCKRDYLQHLVQGTLPDPEFTPHLFLKRAMGKAVDLNMVFLYFVAIEHAVRTYGPEDANLGGLIFLAVLAAYAAGVIFTTGRYGGTPGKRLFGLIVVNASGEPIRYAHAAGRLVAEAIGIACLGLGYFLALGDPRRLTLHDRICQTRVVPRAR